MKLNHHMAGVVIGCMVVGVLVMTVTGLVLLSQHINSESNRVEDEYRKNVEADIATRAYSLATIVESFFSTGKRDLEVVKRYAESLYSGEIPVERFYRLYGSREFPPDPETATVWFNRDQFDPERVPTLNQSSVLENAFRAEYQAHSSRYQNIFIGLESDGTFIAHPYLDISGFSQLRYRCERTGRPIVGFDSRCREWYNDALLTQNAIVTQPYLDAATNTAIITVAQQIPGTGVVAIDLVMQSLKQIVESAKVTQSGYGTLVTRSGDIVIHPGVTVGRFANIGTVDLGSLFGYRRAQILDAIRAGESGQAYIRTKREEKLIRYTPVPGTDFMVCMFADESDLTKPADQNRDSAKEGVVVGSILTAVMTLIMVVLASYLIRRFTKNLVNDMVFSTTHAKKITERRLEDVTHNLKAASSDTYVLGDLYRNLAQIIIYTNSMYRSGDRQDQKKAIENCNSVSEIMQRIQNRDGYGVVQANLANILRDTGELEQARKCYEIALSNANDLLKEAEEEADELAIKFYKRRLATRTDNYGLLFQREANFSDASERHSVAIQMHEQTDNYIGKFHAQGNLGLALLQMNQRETLEEALQMFRETYEAALEKYKESPTANNIELLMFSSHNYGVWYLKVAKANQQEISAKELTGMIDTARIYLQYSLHLLYNLDRDFNHEYRDLYNETMMNLDEIYSTHYAARGDHMSQEIRGALHMRRPIHFVFVLDRSGSMAGSKMQAAKDSIIRRIREMGLNDMVTFISFNTTVTVHFRKIRIGDALEEIVQTIQKTPTSSQTALWDAISIAADDIAQNDISNSDQWIISLTDGCDNKSTISVDSLVNKIEKSRINLIMTSVGLGTEESIGSEIQLLETEISSIENQTHRAVTDGIKLDRIRRSKQELENSLRAHRDMNRVVAAVPNKKGYYADVESATQIDELFSNAIEYIVKGHTTMERL